MIHLTPQQLSAFLDGALTEASGELVRRHLSRCGDCTVRFARMEAQEEILALLLTHDPGDEFFERFLSSFAARDAGKPERAARAEEGRMTRPEKNRRRERPDRDRRQGRPGADQPPGQPASSPVLYGRRAEDSVPRRARKLAAGWIAAACVVVLVAGVAWVAARSWNEPPRPVGGSATSAGRTPTPEELLERTALPGATGAAGATGSMMSPALSPVAGRELERAERASRDAERTADAASFEAAADAWERTLPLFDGLPEEQNLARRRLAQSRYQAWAAGPTAARRGAAEAAARVYLLSAPPGPDHVQARTWLEHLKR